MADEILNFETMSGAELLEFISCFKEEYPKQSEQAFIVFCYKYERDLLQKAEIYCSKFGYSETVALMVAQCTFARVWKYPTFNIKKAKSKNMDAAIHLWLYPILYTQIVLLGKQDTCAEPTEEEDLSVISSVDELISHTVGDDLEKTKDLKARLSVIESALSGLSEKHKIIWLTYKAYEQRGKNIPRSVSHKLQEQLDLTQNSIRSYKMQANQHINDYLSRI
ncbi:hypothetical protein AGMMS49574_26640 [Bacteroidia bacterium]|nr:hypothetical protein AGMMS49574_26640 [Bacteroidia bacterium]